MIGADSAALRGLAPLTRRHRILCADHTPATTRRLVAVLLCLILLVTACTPMTVTGSRTDRAKLGDATLRHDIEPLTKRFPALKTPIEATWMSGELSDNVPGKTIYWIDAVITLDAEALATLPLDGLVTATTIPDVRRELRGALPQGDLLTSPRLNGALSTETWGVTAYLTPDHAQLVMNCVGEK